MGFWLTMDEPDPSCGDVVEWRDPRADEVYFSSMERIGEHLTAAVRVEKTETGESCRRFRAFCGLSDAESPIGGVRFVGADSFGFTHCRRCQRRARMSGWVGFKIAAREDVVGHREAFRGQWSLVDIASERVPVGTDERRYSNKSSPAITTHVYEVSRSVAKTITVEITLTQRVNVGLTLNPAVQASVEATVASRFSSDTQESITVTESVTVEVPAYSAVLVRVHWFEHRRTGLAVPMDTLDRTKAVPFRQVVKLSFDVETVEE
ncbi:hypothetical protein AB0F81_45805 [Actinoplanes sp. NPDC024001]|uniref:hypothetical protein n=1 Tax=Actinoplanes sp. NPDC024001 TaxID=3154598 RepID=UPI0033DFB8A1